VEAPLHLDVVRQRQVLRAVLRVLALALRKVEYVVGDRRGAGVVTGGEKGSPCPCCLSNKVGKVSHLLGENSDARSCLDRLWRRGVWRRVTFRLLQHSDESAAKLQFPRVAF